MSRINVKASAILHASPEAIYATIADCKNGHPYIIPKVFSD